MAAMIDNSIIEEIRARVDIVDVIRERVEIKKAGSVFKGRCPFHNEKTPSFTVSPTRQSYKCFGCGVGGDVFRFIMEQDGLTFVEAVRRLADRAGVEIVEKQDKFAGKRRMLYALHSKLCDFYARCLKQSSAGKVAREYLAGRQIDEQTIDAFSIGYAPVEPHDALMRWAQKNGLSPEELHSAGVALPPRQEQGEWYDRFKGRLIFPIRDERGRVVAFSARLCGGGDKHKAKYVNSPETEIFTKGRVLYGLERASSKIVKHPRREAIICEGQIDVIRCHAAGFETAVASQGTAFSQDHVKLLKRYADCAVLVFDGDDAGRKAAIRTGTLLLDVALPVRVVSLPCGEDPDSLIRSRGYEGFKELLDGAVSLIAFQIDVMRESEENPESIDAINRISRGVLESVAGCSSSVLSNALLREAADMLHLPFNALEADLQTHKDEFKKRASYTQTARKKRKHIAPIRAGALASSDDEGHADESESPPIPDTPQGPPVEDDYILAPGVETPSVARRSAPPCRVETALCELLIEHEHEIPVINLIIEHLPLDILQHRFTRDFVRAVIESNREDSDKLSVLYKNIEPQWKPFFEALLEHQHKMLGAVEATPEEALQDIIRRIWIKHYRTEQGGLPAESNPENDMKRLQLSCLIKQIETGLWQEIRQYLTTTQEPIREEPQGVQEKSSEQAPTSSEVRCEAEACEYEEDNAYAYRYPDGFQPSEYPPDEIPDL
jgi:DNA primase catalytic core